MCARQDVAEIVGWGRSLLGIVGWRRFWGHWAVSGVGWSRFRRGDGSRRHYLVEGHKSGANSLEKQERGSEMVKIWWEIRVDLGVNIAFGWIDLWLGRSCASDQ